MTLSGSEAEQLCGTHIRMDSPSTSVPATPVSARGALDDLDDALVGIRRVLQRPGYRSRLLRALSADLPLATLRLLRAVQRGGAAPSIGEVADVLGVDPSTASRVVERAVVSEYLRRTTCTQDRRRTRLVLTSTGAHLLDEVTARRRELLAEITASWDAADIGELLILLQRLLDGFDTLEASA